MRKNRSAIMSNKKLLDWSPSKHVIIYPLITIILISLAVPSAGERKGHTIIIRNEERPPIAVPVPVPVPVPYYVHGKSFHKSFGIHKGIGGHLGHGLLGHGLLRRHSLDEGYLSSSVPRYTFYPTLQNEYPWMPESNSLDNNYGPLTKRWLQQQEASSGHLFEYPVGYTPAQDSLSASGSNRMMTSSTGKKQSHQDSNANNNKEQSNSMMFHQHPVFVPDNRHGMWTYARSPYFPNQQQQPYLTIPTGQHPWDPID